MLRASDSTAIATAHPEHPSAAHRNNIPPGFRQGYAEHAASIAEKIKESSAASCETLLQMAAWIQEARSHLNRKEFSSFVRDLLEWLGSDARKYINIARVFEGFELSRLSALEPFTLVKLCGKRYQPVVEALKEEVSATSVRVQELVKELLPKQPKKKKPASDYGDAVLQRHPNVEDGTFYFTLKNANLADNVGLWLQRKLENQTIGQVLQQASEAEMAAPAQPNEYTLAQMEEFRQSVGEMRELVIAKEKAEMRLRDREVRIAELEAELARKSLDYISVFDDGELEMYEDLSPDIEVECGGKESSFPPTLAEVTGSVEEISSIDPASAFNVGDFVSHADPYIVAHSYRGIVEQVVGNEVLVRWEERKGKTNEWESYRAADLRYRW